MKHTTILVIDAQGGGLGRQLILEIKKRFAQAEVLAVGTNAAVAATAAPAAAPTPKAVKYSQKP